MTATATATTTDLITDRSQNSPRADRSLSLSLGADGIGSADDQFAVVSLDQLANPPLGQQPNYPWWTIIRAAIMGSSYGILTRDEVCEAVSNRWEYFRTCSAQSTRIWKSAVSHNLSVKECFVRVFVKGKGSMSYYIVDTAVDPSRGRMSRTTKTCSGSEKATIPPTIARKLVLPPNFNLSTRARWSPAIAAIRNAKFGFPNSDSERDFSIWKRASRHQAANSSRYNSESESDISTVKDPTSCINPSLESPLHSMNRRPTMPRLAFSRSLSNALIDSGDSSLSLRRRPPALSIAQNSRKKKTKTDPKSSLPNSSQSFSSPLQPSQALLNVPRIIKPRIVPIQGRSTPPGSELAPPESTDRNKSISLDDQVAAALAGVRACLPQLVEDDESEQDLASNLQSDQPPEPLFDLGSFMKELQSEVFCGSEQLRKDSDIIQNEEFEGVDGEEVFKHLIPAPTEADFEKHLASVLLDNNICDQSLEVDEHQINQNESIPTTGDPNEAVEQDAVFSDLQLLQDMIDQATIEHQQQLDKELVVDNEEDCENQNQFGDTSGDCFSASKMLDLAIKEALEQQRQEEPQEEEVFTYQNTPLRPNTNSNLSPAANLTLSGDIPVHPLPTFATSPTRDSLLDTAPPTPQKSNSSGPKVHYGSIAAIATSASQLPSFSRMINNQSRKRTTKSRPGGRRLNLPLPSSHTSVDDRVDETALAPSFLESIEVVTLERPRSTFPELAKEAIQSHPGGKMTAAEIFKVIEKKYPFFVTAPESWKATLRNVLTSHSCFVKIPRPTDVPGRGDWWSTIDIPLWKRRRTTAKAKLDEDFLGRHSLQQMQKIQAEISIIE